LQAAISTWSSNPWLQVAVFAAIFGGVYTLINLPLSYYSGFILPHRFGMSNETASGWAVDQLKSLAVGVVLGGILIEVIYAVLRLSPDWWWLWVAGILLVFTVLLANLAPVVLMPIFYKFVPLGEEHADLVERLLRLAERAHTQVRGVFTFDMSRRTKAANAALTGLGNTRRIILGDTLIAEFTPAEIETVLAHELGHHAHKDIPVGIVLESVMTLVGLYLASLGLSWGVAYFGFSSVADVAAMPLLILVMGAYGLVTMPLGNAFSRWRERRADEFALRITENGSAYASALARLANQNLAEADPEPWVELLLYSHPSLKRRIAMAQAFSSASPVTGS
jgi:STE24 endopeptidase